MNLNVGLLKIPGDKEKLPVVLIPAFPFNVDFWIPVAKLIPNISYIVNPPGFNPADSTLEKYLYQTAMLKDGTSSLENYASTILNLLELQGVRSFILAGCSMGGYTALAMLSQAPEYIAGLCLLDTNARIDGPKEKAARLKIADSCRKGKIPTGFLMSNKTLLSPINQNNHRLAGFIEKQVNSATPSALAWAQTAMAGRPHRLKTLIESSGIPAVVARGSDDKKSTVAQCQEMAQALGIQPLNIAAAGHLLPIEQPEKIAHLLEHLSRS